MCNFFSLVSKGDGNPMYFNWELRKKCLFGELDYSPDSHTSIADYFGFTGANEDRLNKYEFNPLTKKFFVDQINTTDDRDAIERFCMTVNFKTIVPMLIIKPIICPFKQFYVKKNQVGDIVLLKQWASVRDSVLASVNASVRDTVWNSVRDSVGDSVWNSVWDSVGDSVWNSVWNSVRDSVGGYVSSFYNIKKWKYIDYTPNENPFQSSIDLWEKGIVPSFDGNKWRLHGSNGKILWAGTISEADDFIKENQGGK